MGSSTQMRLLLVVGAGASRLLGSNGPMPLLSNWCTHLNAELEARVKGLAAGFGLNDDAITGPEFEQRIGDALRWKEVAHLRRNFLPLGMKDPGATRPSGLVQADRLQDKHLEEFQSALDKSLWELFGSEAIDAAAARAAYSGLLSQLPPGLALIAATTNYDPALEIAFEELGREPDDGFRGGAVTTPRLKPEGLGSWEAVSNQRIPVMHLHGAVGWYRDKGDIKRLPADQPLIKGLGIPAVLYPDPDKDPTGNPAVLGLWREFEKAAQAATHVLVIGNSLHDAPLNKVLNDLGRRVGVLTLEDDEAISRQLEAELPRAWSFEGEFGPDCFIDVEDPGYRGWLSGRPRHQDHPRDAITQ